MPFVDELAWTLCSEVDPLSSYRYGLKKAAKQGMKMSRQFLQMRITFSVYRNAVDGCNNNGCLTCTYCTYSSRKLSCLPNPTPGQGRIRLSGSDDIPPGFTLSPEATRHQPRHFGRVGERVLSSAIGGTGCVDEHGEEWRRRMACFSSREL